MDYKNGPKSGYDHDVSPYLQRPLRSFAEACRDIAERRQMLRRARLANDNFVVYPVVVDRTVQPGSSA
jgi:hypothetical protein